MEIGSKGRKCTCKMCGRAINDERELNGDANDRNVFSAANLSRIKRQVGTWCMLPVASCCIRSNVQSNLLHLKVERAGQEKKKKEDEERRIVACNLKLIKSCNRNTSPRKFCN